MGPKHWLFNPPMMLLSMLLVISSIPSLNILQGADAQEHRPSGEPDILIDLPEMVHVDVAPGASGQVRLNGTLRCRMPPGSSPTDICKVFISADSNGWPVANPPPLSFDLRSTEEEFYLLTRAPIEAPVEDHLLNITARWFVEPEGRRGETAPFTVRIKVDPYSDISIGSDEPYKRVDLGRWAKFRLRLINEGNTRDNITLNLSYPSNIEVNASFGQMVEVVMMDQMELVLRVRQKSGWEGVETIFIHATGSHPGAPADYSLYLRSSIPVAFYPIGISMLIVSSLLLILIVMVVVSIRSAKQETREKILR